MIDDLPLPPLGTPARTANDAKHLAMCVGLIASHLRAAGMPERTIGWREFGLVEEPGAP